MQGLPPGMQSQPSAAQAQAVESAQTTPIYFPSEDPRYSILTNYIKIDKDNAGMVIEEVNSTLGKAGNYFNLVGSNNKLQFIIQSGSDYRIELSKLAFAVDYVFACENAAPVDTLAVNNENGINPYALFYMFSSISLKINDSAQAVESYESTNEYGTMCQAKMELKYDNTVLNNLSETLFTPVNESTNHAIPDTNAAVWVAGSATLNRTASWKSAIGPPLDINRKYLMFSDLFNFCNVKAVSNNIRKMDVEITLRPLNDPSMVFDIAAATFPGQLAIRDIKVMLHDNRLSPSQNMESIQDKVNLKSERFAFLVANCGVKPYTEGSELPYMQVSNLCMSIFRFKAIDIAAANNNPAQFVRNGITSYLVRYGSDLYPSREIQLGNDRHCTAFYNLLKKVAGKQGLTNHNFGIRHVDFALTKFMAGARFYDSVYPHLSVSKEIRATLTGGGTHPVFYCHFRYRTVIIAGDGTVVIQD